MITVYKIYSNGKLVTTKKTEDEAIKFIEENEKLKLFEMCHIYYYRKVKIKESEVIK